MTLTGGCQCGAIRFAIEGDPGRASICHCRMCQKAFGAFFGPLVSAPQMRWTRGAPKYFASSNRARRGFCENCGTPLSFEPDDGPVELAIGALDNPAAAEPVIQHAMESRLPWLSELSALPTRTAAETADVAGYYASVRSRQHPDHDTRTPWPA
jgi:hypothetical protein